MDADITYIRNSKNDFSREAMFRLFNKMNKVNPKFLVAKHSSIDLVFSECKNVKFNAGETVVVHDDLYAHCGEGKRLKSFVYKEDADKFVVRHYGYPGEPAESWRLLKIGHLPFLLKYTSDDAWRSNCGNVKIEVINDLSYLAGLNKTCGYLPFPTYAIDFVENPEDEKLYAIDFNLSPGYSGVDLGLSDKDYAKNIMYWIEDYLKTNYMKFMGIDYERYWLAKPAERKV